MFLNLSDVSCSEIYHEDAARWVSCNTTSTCIMEAWICDGKQDCLDNQDEKNCPSSGTAFTRNNQLLSRYCPHAQYMYHASVLMLHFFSYQVTNVRRLTCLSVRMATVVFPWAGNVMVTLIAWTNLMKSIAVCVIVNQIIYMYVLYKVFEVPVFKCRM